MHHHRVRGRNARTVLPRHDFQREKNIYKIIENNYIEFIFYSGKFVDIKLILKKTAISTMIIKK